MDEKYRKRIKLSNTIYISVEDLEEEKKLIVRNMDYKIYMENDNLNKSINIQKKCFCMMIFKLIFLKLPLDLRLQIIDFIDRDYFSSLKQKEYYGYFKDDPNKKIYMVFRTVKNNELFIIDPFRSVVSFQTNTKIESFYLLSKNSKALKYLTFNSQSFLYDQKIIKGVYEMFKFLQLLTINNVCLFCLSPIRTVVPVKNEISDTLFLKLQFNKDQQCISLKSTHQLMDVLYWIPKVISLKYLTRLKLTGIVCIKNLIQFRKTLKYLHINNVAPNFTISKSNPCFKLRVFRIGKHLNTSERLMLFNVIKECDTLIMSRFIGSGTELVEIIRIGVKGLVINNFNPNVIHMLINVKSLKSLTLGLRSGIKKYFTISRIINELNLKRLVLKGFNQLNADLFGKFTDLGALEELELLYFKKIDFSYIVKFFNRLKCCIIQKRPDTYRFIYFRELYKYIILSKPQVIEMLCEYNS